MSAQQGRKMILKVGDGGDPTETFSTIAGLQNVSISESNGTNDVTTNDDDGVKRLLDGKYGYSVSISASGMTQGDSASETLKTAFRSGVATNFQLLEPGDSGETITGPFIVTSLERAGEMAGAVTFSIALESAGAITIE